MCEVGGRALQSPGSRRGVAPCRLGAPPAASFSPALPRGCHRPSGPITAITSWSHSTDHLHGRAALRPFGRLASAPVRPGGAPSLPPGQAGRPLRGDRPAPPAFCTSLLPSPGRRRFARTAGPRALRPAMRPHKDADAPLSCAKVARLPPPSSETGGRWRSVSFRSP